MKKNFRLCMVFLISFFVNSLCIGMENIDGDFKCDHYLNCSEKSYTIAHYSNGQPNHEHILCSQCAKEYLIKKLKKWMNLDKMPFYYCGLLKPKNGVKIKYFEPKNNIMGYYRVRPSAGKYIPKTNIKEEVCPEGNEKYLSKYCYIDLENNGYGEVNSGAIYVCKDPNCIRYNDMISIKKGITKISNINFASGQNYVEVKECERNEHIKLDYTIKIN